MNGSAPPSTLPIFRRALADSLPVMAGYGTMGFAAGVLLAVHGGIACPTFWGALSSAAFISGPLQFLFVDWVNASLAIGSVLFIVLCVNLRYSLYGLSLLETFRGARFWTRLYLIAGITDETYALEVACPFPMPAKLRYCLYLTALDHFYWVAGVSVGAFVGASLSIPSAGIDFAMTALFLVILTDQCREGANRAPALIGCVAAMAVFAALTAFLGVGPAHAKMLIPTMALLIMALLMLRGRIDPAKGKRR